MSIAGPVFLLALFLVWTGAALTLAFIWSSKRDR